MSLVHIFTKVMHPATIPTIWIADLLLEHIPLNMVYWILRSCLCPIFSSFFNLWSSNTLKTNSTDPLLGLSSHYDSLKLTKLRNWKKEPLTGEVKPVFFKQPGFFLSYCMEWIISVCCPDHKPYLILSNWDFFIKMTLNEICFLYQF
jgi:hypothetical protein